jgi:hypothetical protein
MGILTGYELGMGLSLIRGKEKVNKITNKNSHSDLYG